MSSHMHLKVIRFTWGRKSKRYSTKKAREWEPGSGGGWHRINISPQNTISNDVFTCSLKPPHNRWEKIILFLIWLVFHTLTVVRSLVRTPGRSNASDLNINHFLSIHSSGSGLCVWVCVRARGLAKCIML